MNSNWFPISPILKIDSPNHRSATQTAMATQSSAYPLVLRTSLEPSPTRTLAFYETISTSERGRKTLARSRLRAEPSVEQKCRPYFQITGNVRRKWILSTILHTLKKYQWQQRFPLRHEWSNRLCYTYLSHHISKSKTSSSDGYHSALHSGQHSPGFVFGNEDIGMKNTPLRPRKNEKGFSME